MTRANQDPATDPDLDEDWDKRPGVEDPDEQSGAIDHDYDDALKDAEETLRESVDGIQREPVEGGVAIDLVTRQPLFIRRQVASDLVEYYDRESFNLLDYKQHAWLPIRIDDSVYECAYLSGNPQEGWKFSRTYDMPRGRLMTVPVWSAWQESDDG